MTKQEYNEYAFNEESNGEIPLPYEDFSAG